MKLRNLLSPLLVLAATPVVSADESLVDQALLALPEELRAGAAVVRFEDGRQVFLREGTNGMYCRADDPDTPGINIWCYPRAHDAYARRWYALAATGMAAPDVDAKIAKEIEAGELEWPQGVVNYNLRGPNLDNALSLTVVYLPFATGADVGIPEQRNFVRPWLMYAGTAFAHIMIPGQ